MTVCIVLYCNNGISGLSKTVLAKDLKLSFYTVPIRNRVPVCRVTVHFTTASPHQLPIFNIGLTANYNGIVC